MPTLKGISWDHPRGFAPMVSTASEYKKKNTEVEIIWDKRPLQAFADRPIEEMAYEYDLMVIDHPHVGEASRKELLIEFDKAEKFSPKFNEIYNDFISDISNIEIWESENIQNYISNFINSNKIKFPIIGKPLRFILINSYNGPSISDIFVILGKKD